PSPGRHDRPTACLGPSRRRQRRRRPSRSGTAADVVARLADAVRRPPADQDSNDCASRAVSDGVLPTVTPAASSATFLASAVPEEPETMAPAWPIVFPSGAVKPAT